MDLVQPRLIEHIIDQGVARSDIGVVISTGLWMVGVALIGMVAGVGCGVFTVLAAQSFDARLIWPEKNSDAAPTLSPSMP